MAGISCWTRSTRGGLCGSGRPRDGPQEGSACQESSATALSHLLSRVDAAEPETRANAGLCLCRIPGLAGADPGEGRAWRAAGGPLSCRAANAPYASHCHPGTPGISGSWCAMPLWQSMQVFSPVKRKRSCALGGARALAREVHRLSAVAVAAFERSRWPSCAPIRARRAPPLGQELVAGVDGAEDMAPDFLRGLHLARDLVASSGAARGSPGRWRARRSGC